MQLILHICTVCSAPFDSLSEKYNTATQNFSIIRSKLSFFPSRKARVHSLIMGVYCSDRTDMMDYFCYGPGTLTYIST